jgi:hypothetical protein
MDRRLKIMTIAISVIYVIIIGGYAHHRVVAAAAYGLKIGIKSTLEGAETGSKATLATGGTFFLSLKPENGFHTFPNTFRNQLDRKPMKAEIERMSVELSEINEQIPRGWLVANTFSKYLSFFGIILMIFIPLQTFRILRSITKYKIFDPSNIRRLRHIGFALLAFFTTGFCVNYIQYWIAANVVEVDGYKLQVDWGNTTLVLLGFVVLMFAEVLKVSVAMKEEHELTV